MVCRTTVGKLAVGSQLVKMGLRAMLGVIEMPVSEHMRAGVEAEVEAEEMQLVAWHLLSETHHEWTSTSSFPRECRTLVLAQLSFELEAWLHYWSAQHKDLEMLFCSCSFVQLLVVAQVSAAVAAVAEAVVALAVVVDDTLLATEAAAAAALPEMMPAQAAAEMSVCRVLDEDL
jgi:hypothetical protein